MNLERDNFDEADTRLQALLRKHLAEELEPHVGSATAKLDALLADDVRASHSRLRFGLRWSAAAMLLIGLGVGGSIVARQFRTPAHGVDRPTVVATGSGAHDGAHNEVTNAIVTNWTETYDGGTVLVDPQTPARVLRRVQYEQTDWKDEHGRWQSKVVVPQQDVILVDVQKQ